MRKTAYTNIQTSCLRTLIISKFEGGGSELVIENSVLKYTWTAIKINTIVYCTMYSNPGVDQNIKLLFVKPDIVLIFLGKVIINETGF